MTDRFGALELPIPVGGFAVRLSVLGAFVRAVLVASAQAAFAGVAPLEPNEIVASVFTEDPKRRAFVEALELPALFVFETKGKIEEGVGDGYNQASTTIGLWWLFPPADKERRRAVDSIAGDLARVLAAAIRDARHPSYVHTDDAADADALRLEDALPASNTIYAVGDFDGVLGSPNRITISKSAGAWDIAAPVVVTVVLPGGTEHAEEVFFTSATDAETVESAWIGESVASVAIPGGQTGTFSIGTALAPGAEHGSAIRDRMGVHRLALTSWERRDLAVDVRHGAPPQKFDGLYCEIAIEETRDRTAIALGYEDLDVDGPGLISSLDGGVSAEVIA